MKKIFAILCAVVALSACNKANLEPELEQNEEIQVKVKISRSDDFGTKATVKSAWAEGDVVFVFFKGIDAPKYLELKYNSGEWTGTRKNSLAASDLTGATDKKMTAIYLPYGSTAMVAASGTDFVFDGLTYNGYFLQAELVDYTFDGSELKGTLNMVAPTLTNPSDKLIHFDISGFTAGHAYDLYQDFVKPLTFTKVSADGAVTKTEGAMCKAITGYEDGTMISFSGILDASAVGTAVDYQFSVNDKTSSFLYTRDAGEKTISAAKYIGIGDISNTTTWTATEYVYLGFNNASGQKICWATKNLGASSSTDYGLYFPWGTTTGYADAASYPYSGESTISCETDTDRNLLPAYDAAHVALKGLWRMPTYSELLLLNSETTHPAFTPGNTDSGITCTGKGEYTGASIFIPAAGHLLRNSPAYQKESVMLYSATRDNSNGSLAQVLYFNSDGSRSSDYRSWPTYGRSIRPVFSID